MRSVLIPRPEIHPDNVTVSISYVVDDPDAAMLGFVVSAAPTYRFKLPQDASLFDLTPHAAAHRLASADARVGELIDAAVRAEGTIKVERRRITRDSLDMESSEAIVDEWAYAMLSGTVSVEDAERELRTVFDAYPEYSVQYDGDFMAMVQRFAADDFYRCHHLANEFLRAAEAAWTAEPLRP